MLPQSLKRCLRSLAIGALAFFAAFTVAAGLATVGWLAIVVEERLPIAAHAPLSGLLPPPRLLACCMAIGLLASAVAMRWEFQRQVKSKARD